MSLSFAFFIFVATVAAGSAYAILMSVLKREVLTRWVQGESWLTAVASMLTLVLSLNTLFNTSELIHKLPGLLLVLSVILSVYLALKLLKVREATLSPKYAALAKSIGIALFSLLSAHWLVFIYLLAF